MKFIPLPLMTWEVQGVKDGRKSQFSKLIKPQPVLHNDVIKLPIAIDEYSKEIKKWTKKGYQRIGVDGPAAGYLLPECPYQEDDVLWVRETYSKIITPEGMDAFVYKADDDFYKDTIEDWSGWNPSINMPKDACRLFLRVKSVRVERLQDISEKDAIAEGVNFRYPKDEDGLVVQSGEAKEAFEAIWQSINGPESWERNDWVWRVETEQIEKPENFLI